MDTSSQPTVQFALRAPLTRADLPGLTARVCRLLEAADRVIAYCDVGEITTLDAVAVDALARLQLAARRRGCQIRLRNASRELLALVRWMGLADVLPAE